MRPTRRPARAGHYLLGLTLPALLVEVAGLHPRLAPLAVIAVLVPLSFAGTRLILARGAKGRQRPDRAA